MFFGKKDKKNVKCENCGQTVREKYNFCPYCGDSFSDVDDGYGFLGREDYAGFEDEHFALQNLGVFDRVFSSMINGMIKNLNKELGNHIKNIDKHPSTEIKSFPNGIRIKISGLENKPAVNKNADVVSQNFDKGIKRMSSMPKEKAKANVKRIGDRVIYELSTPGVSSTEDVFVSKLESGYEIKAIGNKKVYVNNVPINLPMKKFSISKNKVMLEFIAG